MFKIYKVTFNDGGWHSSLPSFIIIAEDKNFAIEKARNDYPLYNDWDCWASEFKVDGYVIEIYDEKTYQRNKNLDKLNLVETKN